MSTAAVRGMVRQLADATAGPVPDADLLTQYARSRDEDAFAELLRRHGPVVLGVCRRALRDAHDAEDAFQAVFLVLARKADTIRPPGMVASWLYGVAVRTAIKARVAAARRWRREMMRAVADDAAPSTGSEIDRAELRAVIDEELGRLPDKYRGPVVLCDLGGKTRSEAARELGCPEGTVAARLHHARKLLAASLTRRGITVPAAGLVALVPGEAVSADLARNTLAAAGAFVAGGPTGVVPPSVRTLAEGVLRTMVKAPTKLVLAVVMTVGLIAGGGFLGRATESKPPPLDTPTAYNSPPAPSETRVPAPPPATIGRWREKAVLNNLGGPVHSVAFSPDGKTFLTGGIVPLPVPPMPVPPAPGGLVPTTTSGVTLWDTDKLLRRWVTHLGEGRQPVGVACSPDGKTVAATVADGINLLDSATGAETRRIRKPGSQPTAIAFGTGEEIRGHQQNRLAFTNGLSLWANIWIDDAATSTSQFGRLAGAPKIVGVPPASVAYSPDGKQLVFIPNNTIDPDWVSGKSKTPQPDPAKATHWYAQVWGGGSGAPMAMLPHGTQPVTAVAWSKDGKWIATGNADGVVVLWDGKLFREARRVDLGGGGEGLNRIPALAFAPDGKTLAVAIEWSEGKNARRVILLDPTTGKRTQEQDLQFFRNAPPVALAFSPDGKTLIVGCGLRDAERRNLTPEEQKKAGEVHVFTTEPEEKMPEPSPQPQPEPTPTAAGDWTLRQTLTDHNGPVDSVAFAPDGRTFLSVGVGERLLKWNTADLKFVDLTPALFDAYLLYSPRDFNKPTVKTLSIAYRPDGKQVAVTREACTGLINPILGQAGMKQLTQGGTAAAFDPTGARLAVSDGFSTTILSLSGNEPAQQIDGPPEKKGLANKSPAGLAWSPDGKRLAFLHMDAAGGGAQVREIGGNGAQTRLGGPDVRPLAIAWSKDGKLIATGQADGTVILWDGESYRERLRSTFDKEESGPIQALTFSPDGTTLAVALTLDGKRGLDTRSPHQVVMIDTQTGKARNHHSAFPAPVRSLAFSPDGKTLLAAYGIDREKMKPLMSAEELKAAGGIRVFTLKPEEKAPEPAAADPQRWQQKQVLVQGGAPFSSVTFAPDGKTFATGGFGPDAVTVWDAATWKKSWDAKLPAGEFTAVAYSREAKYLAAGRTKETVLFDAVTGKTVVSPTSYTLSGPLPGGQAVAFDLTGYRLAIGDGKRTVVKSAPPIGDLTVTAPEAAGTTPMPAGVAWSPDGKRLAHLRHEKYGGTWPVVVSDAGTTAGLTLLRGHTDTTTAVAWSPDGKRIATGGKDGRVILWDAATGLERWQHQFEGRDQTIGRVNALVFSPDSATIAVAVSLGSGKGPERAVFLSVATGTDLGFAQGRQLPIVGVAWGPDGRHLLTVAGLPNGDHQNPEDDQVRNRGELILWGLGEDR